MLFAAYLLVGACAGLLAGMLGIGGGVVLVPALAYAYAFQGLPESSLMHLAVGTSLAAIVPTAASSVYAHHRHRAVQWPLVKAMGWGLVPGAISGSLAAGMVPGVWLARGFGIFGACVAVQLFWNANAQGRRPPPGRTVLALGGFGIGFLSALLGIGGGSITVPWLAYCSVDIRRAVATSAACGLLLGVVGAIGFLATGWSAQDLPPGATGYIYWPALGGVVLASIAFAPVGARLAHRLPVATLKRAFALLLLAVGINMLWG